MARGWIGGMVAGALASGLASGVAGGLLIVGDGLIASRAQAQTVPASVAAAEQEASLPGTGVDALHAPFDRLLDVYVREGFVYYRALKSDRARFDRYVGSLDVAPATYQKWSRDQQLAFWLNAYNAFVLETVIDHYPIRGRSAAYPANSIRHVPGAFDKTPHRAAGRTVTLDDIEKTILPEFKDARVYLALGRGSIGGGRLRSEVYTSERLDAQLADTGKECVGRKECVQLDEGAATLSVSPLFSWREAQFAETLGVAEMEHFPGRSPIERAVLRLIEPFILPNERVFLRQNKFAVKYGVYDWRLNDLTGGMPDR